MADLFYPIVHGSDSQRQLPQLSVNAAPVKAIWLKPRLPVMELLAQRIDIAFLHQLFNAIPQPQRMMGVVLIHKVLRACT